ncbi:Lrp/AsnC family transcriptional regulator [Lacibacterium aquatile]|uniref:Lrp/AsnC family transcriptional regulator n=1 Tax=Lacibacterium aquatile TaxID=1168082 RepID=A0ABW5DTU0_9PROT
MSDLDIFDRRLLALVQEDASLTSEQLGEQVGLSAAACRRRLQSLKKRGVIEREVALLAPQAAGNPITVVVQLWLLRDRADILDRFAKQIRQAPEVQQCWYVTGSCDIVMVLSVADMAAYEAFTRAYFLGSQHVKRFETMISMRRMKFTTALPLGLD